VAGKTQAHSQQTSNAVFVGVDVAAELVPGISSAQQDGTMLPNREVEQESGSERDI
jgi:hypothetical protein